MSSPKRSIWAVHNDMDVISNVAWARPYGVNRPPRDADRLRQCREKAGIIVVAAAGNNGPAPLYYRRSRGTASPCHQCCGK